MDNHPAHYAVQNVIEAFRKLDFLVNNAGYGNVSSIEDAALPEIRARFDTNLFGGIIMTEAAIRVWPQQGSGHFIQFPPWSMNRNPRSKRLFRR